MKKNRFGGKYAITPKNPRFSEKQHFFSFSSKVLVSKNSRAEYYEEIQQQQNTDFPKNVCFWVSSRSCRQNDFFFIEMSKKCLENSYLVRDPF